MADVGEPRRVRLQPRSADRLVVLARRRYATALEIALVAVVYAWWSGMLERALAGRTNVLPLLPLTVGWSFFANGILPVVECQPPCADVPRPRDVAVVGNVILGPWPPR
jgi:hypothetical protein